MIEEFIKSLFKLYLEKDGGKKLQLMYVLKCSEYYTLITYGPKGNSFVLPKKT